MSMTKRVDALDLALLRLLATRPKAGMREYARVLEVARGTVQSRLGRLERLGVITDYAPQVSSSALGYPVTAFVHIHLAQGQLARVTNALQVVDEVVEAHSIAGEGDLLARVVARDTNHLEDIIQRLLDVPGIVRTRTEIALTERIHMRSTCVLSMAEPASDQ